MISSVYDETFQTVTQRICNPHDLTGSVTEIRDDLPLAKYLNFRAVSNSLLKALADCPLAALEYLTTRGHAPTPAMVMGSAVDCLLCEPHTFADRFYLRPDEVEGEKWQGNRKACKQWIAEHTDRPVITPADFDEAERMVRTIRADKRAAKLLDGALTQRSVFWQDKKTKLQMMGRPDFILPRAALDLKTTSDASTPGFAKQIDNLGYHVQAALYADALEANGRECNTFYFFAVQGGERPKVNVRYLKSEALELGRAEYQSRLRQLRECIDRNEWPGYSGPGDEVQPIDLPPYVYSRIDDATTLEMDK